MEDYNDGSSLGYPNLSACRVVLTSAGGAAHSAPVRLPAQILQAARQPPVAKPYDFALGTYERNLHEDKPGMSKESEGWLACCVGFVLGAARLISVYFFSHTQYCRKNRATDIEGSSSVMEGHGYERFGRAAGHVGTDEIGDQRRRRRVRLPAEIERLRPQHFN
jgi:hypothetical protein